MKIDAFPETFATLRALLDKHAQNMLVHVHKPGDYQLCSTSRRSSRRTSKSCRR